MSQTVIMICWMINGRIMIIDADNSNYSYAYTHNVIIIILC